MAIIAKLDRWGNEYWTDVPDEEVKPCTPVQNVDKPAVAAATSKTTTPATSITKPASIASPRIAMPTEKTRIDMSATLPATIDTAPLVTKLDPERRDFDHKLSELRDIDPKAIKANLFGKRAADLAACYDALAKDWIAAVDADFEPSYQAARNTLEAIRNQRDRIKEPAVQLRNLAKPIIASHALAVQQKIEHERRVLEHQQREAAEAERRARYEAEQAEAARLREEAKQQANAALAADLEMQAEHKAQDAAQTLAAPLTPVAVPAEAVAPPKVEGISATFVFVHGIKDWAQFCTYLSKMNPTILQDENETGVTLPGIKIVLNFTGLKKTGIPLPGGKVEKKPEIRNRRR